MVEKPWGLRPHFDALVHANEISAESVRSTSEWGGTHTIIHDSKATAGSQKLAQRIVTDAVDPAAKSGIAVANRNGMPTKSFAQANATLLEHAAHFDSQVLIEVAAQDDAVGQMLQKKGVQLTPAFEGVSLANVAGKGGAGFSAEVQAYGRWLSGGKPDISQVKATDRLLLEKIAKVIPLKDIPAATAQHMQSTGFVDGLANALDTHATQDLGHAKTVASPQKTPAPSTSNPATSSTPNATLTSSEVFSPPASEKQEKSGNPLSWIMNLFQPIIAMFMPFLAPIIAIFTGNNQAVAQTPAVSSESTSVAANTSATPSGLSNISNSLIPSPTPQKPSNIVASR
jgi:hypothetical protein